MTTNRRRPARAPAGPAATTPVPPARPRVCAPARCTAKTKTGRPCRAAVIPGRDVCALHAPELEHARAAARRRAAATTNNPRRRKTLPAGAAAPPLATVRDLARHLAEVVHKVETGALDRGVAAVVAQLAGVLRGALGEVEQLERLGRVEQRVAELEASTADDRDVLAATPLVSEARQ